MNTFIVGGTGFIGYHSALEFLKRGHNVFTLSLPDIKPGPWFPQEIVINYGNIFEMTEKQLINLFKGQEALVYAIGPDDRVTPEPPAYKFFHEYLVKKCGYVISAAQKAGIKKCVVLNSYFAYFDRTYPEYKLSEHHPYIKCRIEQAETVISTGGNGMDVMVLELPYIFGTMPGRTPLWKDVLLKMRIDKKYIFYPHGGSNMISVEHVAEAVAGAVERGKHGKRYLVGDVNMNWVDMLTIMFHAMGKKNKKVITVPCFFAALYGRFLRRSELRAGKESGLNYSHLFKDFLCREFYYDPVESSAELGYSRGGVPNAIKKTIKAFMG